MGLTQNTLTVNFPHMLDEQAHHIAYLLQAANERQAQVIEPTESGEAAWVETIRTSQMGGNSYLAECTPGYYNNEGQPLGKEMLLNVAGYPAGPVAFFSYIDRWRSSGEYEGLEFR
jgi:cyclohexanone monooxygenase